MYASWTDALIPLATAGVVVLVPGLLIIIAGWGLSRPQVLLLAPATSMSVIAAAAVLAPWVGLRWSVGVALALSLLIAAIAYVLRGPAARRPFFGRLHPMSAVTLAALALSAALITIQLMGAFGTPEAIAQRFDNIVHLNTVRFALDTANASPFHVGATSDIPFYPSGWHALTSLVAQLTGVSVPVAVNIANIVIAAVVWPTAAAAAAVALIGDRKIVAVSAAAMATGFGLFPALFFNWGVLYPNVAGYAMVPAMIAGVALLFQARGPWSISLTASLLLLVAGGTALAHPNALLAGYAMGGVYAIAMLVATAANAPSKSRVIGSALGGAGIVAIGAVIWTVARTNAAHSQWDPWQSTLRAIWDGAFVTPRGYPPTVIIVLLLVLGLITATARPRSIPVLVPFVVAIGLFVVAAGLEKDAVIRQLLTNPWYNDANRLAALLPVGAVPAAALGARTAWDTVLGVLRRYDAKRVWRVAAASVFALVLFSVAFGPNVQTSLNQVGEAYSTHEESILLSTDERVLLDRLDESVPPNALVAGSPRTGASLAYALAERPVTEMHIYGERSADELLIDKGMIEIADNPEVCVAAARLGVEYVLDFGDQDIQGDPVLAKTYAGLLNLEPDSHLVLVDSEGQNARLFRVEGCDQ